MASENIIDFTATNWITVFVMVVTGFLVIGIAIGIYSKFKGNSAGGA